MDPDCKVWVWVCVLMYTHLHKLTGARTCTDTHQHVRKKFLEEYTLCSIVAAPCTFSTSGVCHTIVDSTFHVLVCMLQCRSPPYLPIPENHIPFIPLYLYGTSHVSFIYKFIQVWSLELQENFCTFT